MTSKQCVICKVTRASFGLPSDKIPKYCSSCKNNDMIDLRHRKCIKCNIVSPNFGLPNQKRQYCANCKTDDMVDLLHHKCIVCKIKNPSYGLPNEKPPRYCGSCKTYDMIDLKHPKCIECCQKQPVFGYLDGKKLCCFSCKKDGMINLMYHRYFKQKNKKASSDSDHSCKAISTYFKKEKKQTKVQKVIKEKQPRKSKQDYTTFLNMDYISSLSQINN